MTGKQRDALLRLPEMEAEVLHHHMFDPDDLAAVKQCRTPETRLSYVLQLCCLRFPGRYLSRGELLAGIMLDHIADQVQADADVIALFARHEATRYEQLTTIKECHGFRDLSQPLRVELAAWAQNEAVGLTDGRVFLDRLIERMRAGRIIIPGISVVERLAATAMHSADLAAIAEIGALLSPPQCDQMDVLLSAKVHRQQSRRCTGTLASPPQSSHGSNGERRNPLYGASVPEDECNTPTCGHDGDLERIGDYLERCGVVDVPVAR